MAFQPLYDISVIEKPIKAALGNENTETTIAILEGIRLAMNNYCTFRMPIVLTDEAIERLGLNEDTDENPNPDEMVDPEHDFTLRTLHNNETDKDWLVAFTSEEESKKGPESAIYTVPLFDILPRVAGIDAVEGIVINPWGTAFTLRRSMIEEILRINNPESQIFFNLGDITTLECDAIVNAANERLTGGGGVDGAIHQAAGKRLNKACSALGGCKTGEAKITKGYDLKARYIIHTVGPVYKGKGDEASYLAECYLNSLNLAMEHNIHSIAFPAISTGAYKFPAEEAASIALDIASQWLELHSEYGMQVIFCCHDQDMLDIYQRVLSDMTKQMNPPDLQGPVDLALQIPKADE